MYLVLFQAFPVLLMWSSDGCWGPQSVFFFPFLQLRLFTSVNVVVVDALWNHRDFCSFSIPLYFTVFTPDWLTDTLSFPLLFATLFEWNVHKNRVFFFLARSHQWSHQGRCYLNHQILRRVFVHFCQGLWSVQPSVGRPAFGWRGGVTGVTGWAGRRCPTAALLESSIKVVSTSVQA